MSTESRNAVIYINGQEVNNTMRSIEAHARKVRNEMALLTRGTAEYDNAIKGLKDSNKIIAQHRASVSGVNKEWENVKSSLKGFGASMLAYLGGNAIMSGFRNLIQKNVELSDAQTAVQRTTQLSDTQMQELEKRFSAFNTRTPRMELLKLAEEAGKQGKNTVGSVAEFVDEMNKAKIALGGDLGEGTIEALGKLTTIFDTSSLKIGNAIKAIADNSIASAPYQVDFMMRTAGVANTVKIAADELLGYGAVLENLGQSQEVSGTAINQFLLKLTSNTEEFGAIAGFASGELSTLIGEKGTNEGFIAFLEKLKGGSTGTQDLIQKLNDLGLDGTRNAAVLLTLANNTELLAQQQAIAKKNIGETTLVMESYNKANTNFAANWQILMKNIGSFFVNNSISQGFMKLIGNLVDTRSELTKVSEAYVEQKKYTADLEKGMNPLIKRYNELKGEGKLNGEQQTELNAIINKIAAVLPSAVVEWDNYGNAIDISTGKVQSAINKNRELTQALGEKEIKQLTESIGDLGKEAADIQAMLNKGGYDVAGQGRFNTTTHVKFKDEEITTFSNKLIRVNKEMYDQLKRLENEYQITLTKSQQQFISGFEKQYNVVNEVTKAVDESTIATNEFSQATELSKEELKNAEKEKENAIKLLKDNKTSIDSYVQAINDSQDAIDEVVNSEIQNGLQQIDEQFVKLVGEAEKNGYKVEDVYLAWGRAIDAYKRKMAEARVEQKLTVDSFVEDQRKRDKERRDAEAKVAQAEEDKQAAKESYMETTIMAGMAAVDSAESEEEALRNVANVIRDAIKQKIAEAIVSAISSALASVPFPFNIILATAAGAAASGLFNQIIPQFKDGTDNAPSGWKLVGEEGPELIYDNGGYGILPAKQTQEQLNWMQSKSYGISMPTGSGGSSNMDLTPLINEIIELKKIMRAEKYVVFPDTTVKKFPERLDLLTKMTTKTRR